MAAAFAFQVPGHQEQCNNFQEIYCSVNFYFVIVFVVARHLSAKLR